MTQNFVVSFWIPACHSDAILPSFGDSIRDSLEKQLARDLLFRLFIALDISESVPDHSTFWRFRQTLDKLLLMDKLL
ncbi:MAG: transposase [Candidatus Endonucleobacter bathymodioli]|uniref:Transposase n=1 Tax=Candidatus Endonucleibacter bathymodioli TaxID=539814 RepID=A0AA90NMT8_9GAMM|nr:transposase [Candidatus Endonucleobacter bathymodioli]